MLKKSDNPPPLFPPGADLRTLSGRWWLAHTKARFEKSFAWDLAAQRIAYFLPLVQRVLVSNGRKWKSIVPLFASYVFFNGDESARVAAMMTNRLCQVITVTDQDQLLRELLDIQRVIDLGMTIHPLASVCVGSHCRVAAGPLQGLEGTLIRRDQSTRFVLSVSILGQGAELEIEPDLLEDAETVSRTDSHSSVTAEMAI